jgi:hypothetical protein
VNPRSDTNNQSNTRRDSSITSARGLNASGCLDGRAQVESLSHQPSKEYEMNAIKKLGMAAMTMGLLFAASGAVRADFDESTIWTRDFHKAFGTMKMMKMMDKDGDHTVSKDEFLKHMEAMFDMMDKNHDGKLDVKEFMYNKVFPN